MREAIPLSPLGFGCAPVMGRVGKAEALRAMASAFESGVTHFDVARSYGFGRAEGVVGRFIKGKRDKVTVTTKFGVVPPTLGFKTKMMIPVAREVTKFLPGLKDRLKKKSGQLLAERNFDVSYARKCLDQSLAELGTDYIDIYLVHEPVNAASIKPGDLHEFLEASAKSGKIRRWGYALQAPADYTWVAGLGGDVTQFEGNFSTLPTVGALVDCETQRIVTRPFAGGGNGVAALQTAIQQLNLGDALRDIDATVADLSLCIGRALSGANGTVLCSMFSTNHVRQNAQSLRRFEGDPRMTSIVSAVIQAYTGISAPTQKK